MFDKILIPVDFSELSKIALSVGAQWASRFESTLELIHVVEDAPYSYPPIWPGEAPLLHDLREQAVRNATTKMQQVIADLEEHELRGVDSCVDSGAIVPTISRHAKRVGAKLIVAATQGRTGLSRLLMGSTCEHLLRSAPCPVLIARAGAAEHPPPVTKLLVAVDFSDHARRAVEVAAQAAKRWNAELHVFHAWPAPYPLADVRIEGDIFSKLCHAADDELGKFLEGCSLPAGVVAHRKIASGTPAAAIAEHVGELHPDVLCLGTHGRSGFKQLLLGSVAEATVRSAPCTTLVVP